MKDLLSTRVDWFDGVLLIVIFALLTQLIIVVHIVLKKEWFRGENGITENIRNLTKGHHDR